jgi:3',5'-cyclic AMP phosphodiesterase CpdA
MNSNHLRAVLALLALSVAASCTGRMGTPRPEPDADAGGRRDADVAADADADADADAGDPDAAPDADADANADADADADEGPPPASFSFVVFGDNQFATTSCTSGVPERLAIPAAILEVAPDFVVHTGDLADRAAEDGAYENVEGCYDDLFAAVPFFPTMGNHDAGYTGVANYEVYLERQLFATNAAAYGAGYDGAFAIAYEDDPNTYSEDFDHPANTDDVPSGVSFETFYAHRYENSYFLSLEVGTRWWSDTPKSWLRSHLEAARADPTIDHVFVHLHHPIFTTTMSDTADGESAGPVREDYEPIFREFDVTMVFSGHAHLYDRFYVPDDRTPTRAPPAAPPAAYPNDGSGVHYVVTGGGGGPLNACNPELDEESYDFAQARRCGYHFLQVQVEGHRVAVRVIGVTGTGDSHTTEVWDEFALE